MINLLRYGVLGVVALAMGSCTGDAVPKPEGKLRLDYPMAKYQLTETDCAYGFYSNTLAELKPEGDCSYALDYPQMKATLYLTYKAVQADNLKSLLRDAQKLTYNHVIKADAIIEQPFINPDRKVYGMFYGVGGNAATNSQFYVTDSTRHFISGSLYFYAKPNYDSIMPAVEYIKNDMQILMETLYWK